MSKKMTPCERLGYKVGDKFTVIKDSYFEKGAIVALSEDDGSEVPWFTRGGVRRALIIGSNPDVEPAPSKLKPAKQAMADAIHQNGGWYDDSTYACQHKINNRVVFTKQEAKPICEVDNWWWVGNFVSGFDAGKVLQNWHQTILSRDEYLTAYPEQKVEVNNETEHKVEVEMKSESEMTIKAGDWHKNGELPPVGEVCEVLGTCDGKPAWGVGVIVAHTSFTDKTEIAIARHDDIFDFGWGGPEVFRPLRTERDRAIDEMMSVAAENWGNLQDCCERLYECGYRKEVK